MPPGMGFALDGLQEEDLTAKAVPRGTAWPFIIRVVTAEHVNISNKIRHHDTDFIYVILMQAEGIFSMHVLKQVWWRDGVAYVLNEIFGIDSQPEESSAATMDDSGKVFILYSVKNRSVVDSLLQIKLTSCTDTEPGNPISASPPTAGFTSIPLAKAPCQSTESPACDPLTVTIS
eukprot:SM000426S15717  [mRNA]  locus=s426:26950:28442:+ [translate_table: standard]